MRLSYFVSWPSRGRVFVATAHIHESGARRIGTCASYIFHALNILNCRLSFSTRISTSRHRRPCIHLHRPALANQLIVIPPSVIGIIVVFREEYAEYLERT